MELEGLRTIHRAVRVLRLLSEYMPEVRHEGYMAWLALRLWETADELDRELKRSMPRTGALDATRLRKGDTC